MQLKFGTKEAQMACFNRESRVDKGPQICGSVLFGILLDQNDTFPSHAPPLDIMSEALDLKNDWASLSSFGSLIDIDGEIITKVHVAQTKLQLGEKIELCRERVPEGSFHCGYGLCISSTLVKDGVINCPFADCIDEGSCEEARHSNITNGLLISESGDPRFSIEDLSDLIDGVNLSSVVTVRAFGPWGLAFF
ncbi:hypothetical protein J437_LFUL015894 [Ladona fulva]|uniref:Uncharacterized protein n=1 Tax=Ladona fulva TaxID=123851 RepID=A0A8K0KN10_LADFU|nr:hypothetical protein J437_LFUL015894 [Ladona fulva]